MLGDLEIILLVTVYPLAIVTTALVKEHGIFSNLYVDRIEKFFRKWSLYIYLYNLPSLIIYGMINKCFNFYFGNLWALLVFLLINLTVGISALFVSQTDLMVRRKREFVRYCNHFLEEITW